MIGEGEEIDPLEAVLTKGPAAVEWRREGGFDFWRFDSPGWAFSEICYMGVFRWGKPD